jgi:hypothetical protein
MSRQSSHSCNVDRDAHPFSLSPPPHRLCHHGGERIVERGIERSASNVVYPTLTRTNLMEWSLVMKVNLQAARL